MKTIIYILSFVVISYSISLFIFGNKVKYKLPQKMESFFSYHSSLSDKSYDNWLIAQRIFGHICLKSSYVIIPINVVLNLLFFFLIKQENITILAFLTLLIFDLFTLKVNKFMTEKELKKI